MARALALHPRLIIADEPTAGLDVSVQGEILNLMAELQRQHGLAYIIITHNLPVVRHVSDRLAIMYLGRLVEQGDCDAIFQRPAHPYSEALVQGVPRPDPRRRRSLVSIEGRGAQPGAAAGGLRVPHPAAATPGTAAGLEAPAARVLSDGRRVRCHYSLVE